MKKDFPKGLIITNEEELPESFNMKNGDVFTALEEVKIQIYVNEEVQVLKGYILLEFPDENVNGKIMNSVFNKRAFTELDDLTFKKINDNKNEYAHKSD
jgi:hypothetical protein